METLRFPSEVTYVKQCLGCLAQLEEDVEVCPYCGYVFKYVKRPNNIQGANKRRTVRPRTNVVPQEAPEPENDQAMPSQQMDPIPYQPTNPVPQVKRVAKQAPKAAERVREREEELPEEEAPSLKKRRSSKSPSPLAAIQNTFSSLLSKGNGRKGIDEDLEEDVESEIDDEEFEDMEGREEGEEPNGSIPALLSSLFGNTGNNVTRGIVTGLVLLFALAFLVLLIRGIFFQGKKLDHQVDSTTQESSQNTETGEQTALYTLTDADEELKTLVVNYFNAYNNKDLEAARQLLDELPASEEKSILNSAYDHYAVSRIYSAKDATNNEAVILALYTYQLAGIETPLPASSWLYVKKDEQGKWRILHPSSIGEDFRTFILGVQSTEEAKAILSSIREEYDATVSANPKLQAALGEKQTSSSSSQTSSNSRDTVRATTNVNVRATPDSEGEIVGSVKEGQTLVKTGVDGEWIKVIYKNQPSYVFGEFFVDASTNTGATNSSANANTSADESQNTQSEDEQSQEEYSEEEYSEEEYYEENYEEEYYEEDYTE